VAQSLYAIQLEEWFHYLRQVGKDPADCVKIILSSDLKRHQQAVAKDLLNWIGIPTVQKQQPQGTNSLESPSQHQYHIQGHSRTRYKTQLQQKGQQPKGMMVTTYTSPPMREETI
jgi:hypothetical protein